MLDAVKSRKYFSSVAICLVAIFVGFAILTGCKQKEQPAETKQQPETTDTTTQQPSLSILYAGHPGSEREKDFVEFLAKHFKSVETGDLKTFTDSNTEGFDVTILDYDGDGFEAPRPSMSRNFSQPVVTVGVIGAFICSSQNLKTGLSYSRIRTCLVSMAYVNSLSIHHRLILQEYLGASNIENPRQAHL